MVSNIRCNYFEGFLFPLLFQREPRLLFFSLFFSSFFVLLFFFGGGGGKFTLRIIGHIYFLTQIRIMSTSA